MFQKKYTFAEITEVLLKLRENKGIMYKTSKDMGVSVDTIKRWRDMYATEVWTTNPSASVNDQLKERLVDENAAVRQKAKEVAEKALDKMLIMMDSRRISMKDLVEAFKTIGPYLLPKFDQEGGKDLGKVSIENNYATFVQKMYTNLNKDGTKTIRIQGDQKKLPGGQ